MVGKTNSLCYKHSNNNKPNYICGYSTMTSLSPLLGIQGGCLRLTMCQQAVKAQWAPQKKFQATV